jgi:hypothetical protein
MRHVRILYRYEITHPRDLKIAVTIDRRNESFPPTCVDEADFREGFRFHYVRFRSERRLLYLHCMLVQCASYSFSLSHFMRAAVKCFHILFSYFFY